MTPEDLELLEERTLAGLCDAHEAYDDMSGGYWLWTGAEYFLTCEIAKSIYSGGKGKFLCGVEESIANFNFRKGRPRQGARRGGRCDIAVWSPDEKLVAVVEVKNSALGARCENDIARLIDITAASRESVVSILAYYFSVEEENGELCRAALKKRRDEIAQYCENPARTPSGNKVKCKKKWVICERRHTDQAAGTVSMAMGFIATFSRA